MNELHNNHHHSHIQDNAHTHTRIHIHTHTHTHRPDEFRYSTSMWLFIINPKGTVSIDINTKQIKTTITILV